MKDINASKMTAIEFGLIVTAIVVICVLALSGREHISGLLPPAEPAATLSEESAQKVGTVLWSVEEDIPPQPAHDTPAAPSDYAGAVASHFYYNPKTGDIIVDSATTGANSQEALGAFQELVERSLASLDSSEKYKMLVEEGASLFKGRLNEEGALLLQALKDKKPLPCIIHDGRQFNTVAVISLDAGKSLTISNCMDEDNESATAGQRQLR